MAKRKTPPKHAVQHFDEDVPIGHQILAAASELTGEAKRRLDEEVQKLREAPEEPDAFRATTISGTTIKMLFEVLKEILHDVPLHIAPDGIRIMTLDGSRNSLTFLKLKAEEFNSYYCPSTIVAGVNLTCMYKLLKSISGSDVVTLYQKKGSPHMLGILITNGEKNSRTDFKLKLIEVDSEDITLPEIQFDGVFTLPSQYFQRLCRDMVNIGDVLRLQSQGNTLTMSCEGDFASQETTISEGDADVMSIATNSGKRVSANFSLRYLTLFCKASSLCNTIALYLGDEYPLIMVFKVAALGELKFVLTQLDD